MYIVIVVPKASVQIMAAMNGGELDKDEGRRAKAAQKCMDTNGLLVFLA